MKIMFLLNALSCGGAERVTATLANHWARSGHDVVVMTMEAHDDFYDIDSRVDRRRMALSRPSTSFFSALSGAIQRIRAIRASLHAVQPDIAIAMMTSWNVELALASRGLSVIAIGSERIYPPSLPLNWVWRTLRRFSYGQLDAVVAQTEMAKHWLLAHTNARKVCVIANPLPAFSDTPPAILAGANPATPLLLAVGRLVPQKRFDRIISAIAGPSMLGWHLAIVGNGELQEQLSQLAEAAGVADRVHFPGSTDQVERWYRRAAIFALSSDYEGFPNALLEAMAMGLPAVAMDCPTGPSELIDNVSNGYLVPLGDQAAFESALGILAHDQAVRARIGACAKLDVEYRFSIRSVAAEWEALFGSMRKAGVQCA